MKKKILLLSVLLATCAVNLPAAKVELGVGEIDPTSSWPGSSKTPVFIPSIDLEGHVIAFETGHADFTLSIIDENDNIVYSVYVPSSVTIVNLPTTLSGSYELCLYPDGSNIYFFGFVLF